MLKGEMGNQSSCFTAGIHPKIVSEMLGHSSVAFTLDVYSHVVGGLQKAAMKRLDEVLLPEFAESEDVGKMSAKEEDSSARLEGFEPISLGSEDENDM